MIRLSKYVGFMLLVLASSIMVIATPSVASDDFIFVLDQSGSMREKVPGEPKKGYEPDPLKANKSKGAIDALNSVADNILSQVFYAFSISWLNPHFIMNTKS